MAQLYQLLPAVNNSLWIFQRREYGKIAEEYQRRSAICCTGSLIDKARKTSSPNEDKLETLISFSNTVQNLVANMRILKGTLYMLNPELTDELASKMPSHLKLKWGRFVLKQSDPITLDHFANWLDSVANAASITSIFTSKTVSENVDNTSLHQRRDRKRNFANTVLTVTEDKKNENASKAKRVPAF
ncbi:unnamed protein product [Allacma fusca]|uniref:Uncharacterized protein n=1 Tax=Allacma fusca TaxID=39272 RepID=A0A8J2NKV5_9HEXA|nr:unnamed protein product [Allacma fusca]